MEAATGSEVLRAKIDELKQQLVSFVLFEIREGESAQASPRLAAPLQESIESAVRGAIDTSFAEGAAKIGAAADRLIAAGDGAARRAEAIEQQLGALQSALANAKSELASHLELCKKAAALDPRRPEDPGGPEGASNAALDRLNKRGKGEQERVPPDLAEATPQDGKPGVLVGQEESSRFRSRLGASLRWLKDPIHVFWLALGIAFVSAVAYAVPLLFSRYDAVEHDQRPAMATPYLQQAELRESALRLQTLAAEEDLLALPADERRRQLAAELQSADRSIVAIQAVLRNSPSGAADLEFQQELRQLMRAVSAARAFLGTEETEPLPRARLAELRSLGDRLLAAAAHPLPDR